MTDRTEPPTPDTPSERFGRSVAQKEQRRKRAREEDDRSTWFWVGMFGLVGWSVSVPTVAGIALGVFLDRRLEGDVSWTLTMLLLGVGVGCFNAWYWICRES